MRFNTEAYPVTSLLAFLCVTVFHKSAGEACESYEAEYDEDMAEFVHPDHEAMEEGTLSDEDDDQQS